MNQQQQMMRQLQKMQADMAKAQQELAEAEVQGTAGGGMVTVTAAGNGDIKKGVKIDPKAVDPDDVEMLEDLVVAAIADAKRAADAMQQSKLGGLTQGLNIPGF